MYNYSHFYSHKPRDNRLFLLNRSDLLSDGNASQPMTEREKRKIPVYWELSHPWALTDSYAYSGDFGLTDRPDGNYENDMDVSASVSVDLDGRFVPILTFQHRSTDYGRAQISTYFGQSGSWDTLATHNGTNTTWSEVQIALSEYVGFPNVRIRFVVDDNSDWYNRYGDGWYIDDVLIGEGGPCYDEDDDGYGDPASAICHYAERDCDDTDPEINPGVIEGPPDDPTCFEGIDNDCDTFTDGDDPSCPGGQWTTASTIGDRHSKAGGFVLLFLVPALFLVAWKRIVGAA